MASIGIIDYGMGNLHSLSKAFARVCAEDRVEVTYDPDKLARAEHLVLPGVGGARHCMDELNRLELDAFVREIAGKVPLLGVCLGMQIMLEHSDENGGADCLGLFKGTVEAFPEPDPSPEDKDRLKVPHMGWNQVAHSRTHPLLDGVSEDAWFYFVHSYRAIPDDEADVLGTTDHGVRFASMLCKPNIVACQFHPEKSQGAGMTLLANFVHWDGAV